MLAILKPVQEFVHQTFPLPKCTFGDILYLALAKSLWFTQPQTISRSTKKALRNLRRLEKSGRFQHSNQVSASRNVQTPVFEGPNKLETYSAYRTLESFGGRGGKWCCQARPARPPCFSSGSWHSKIRGGVWVTSWFCPWISLGHPNSSGSTTVTVWPSSS